MTPFFKLSGAGNDFIAIPEPPGEEGCERSGPSRPITPERVRAWCARGLSVGADGLFLLTPPSGDEAPDTVGMRYFNADGSTAALCINGTRCAALLAVELGWSHAERVRVRTGAGVIAARVLGPDQVALELEPPASVLERTLELGGVDRRGFLVDAGVPHFVLPWPDLEPEGEPGRGTQGLEEAPVRSLGAQLRSHRDLGANGANIDFVRFVGPDHLEIRSFERGVEGETLACGTGVLAAVAAGLESGVLALPVTVLTRGGFELRVDGAPATGADPRSWTLAGDARLVARGELLAAAGELPAPPPWS